MKRPKYLYEVEPLCGRVNRRLTPTRGSLQPIKDEPGRVRIRYGEYCTEYYFTTFGQARKWGIEFLDHLIRTHRDHKRSLQKGSGRGLGYDIGRRK